MEPESKKPRTETGPTTASTASTTTPRTTVYVRCNKLHRRGELVNDFLYQHRAALGMDSWYDPATHQLFADAPLEVVLMHTSKKPFFLVEWRHPTAQERAQQKPQNESATPSGDGEGHTVNEEKVHEEGEGEKASPPPPPPAMTAVLSPDHAFADLSEDVLASCAARLLALAREATPEAPLTFNGEPVVVSMASDGVTVADAREKLHLRDLVRKKAAAEEAKARAEVPKPTVTSFVPRVVRRRN